jgi:riboflavin kinase/FMN adenylyltransferase
MTRRSGFGRGRGGTFASMTALGRVDGFAVIEVPERSSGDTPISSSRIREAVVAGRLSEAARLLGRRYAVTGTVVRGDGRGRALGFPTANLAFDQPVALPPDGIYACRVSWDTRDAEPAGADHRGPRAADGVASLGVRPTFGPGGRVLEVYLLDIDEDLYGARVRVAFVRRQRGERRYGSVGALVAQMDRDVARARVILSRARR